jgi:phenylpropionate dioxygenase-like ring-hydroxylating dioxygenase large terminal subunit
VSGWVAVALSADLAPGEVFGTQCVGLGVAVWRDASGVVRAFEDRCPHRGLRLSLGFVRGDSLACLYHGWRFEGGGACRLIPAHPELKPPSTIRATSLEAREASGLVWISTTPRDEAPPALGEALPLRSVFPRVPLARAEAAWQAAPPSGFRVTRAAPGGFLVEAGGASGFVALQALGEAGSACHAVLLGAADRAPLARALGFWRDALEGRA